MTIANYNFFMAIFCFFSKPRLYDFCNNNKNDNSNKTWSLKLLNLIKLYHQQNGHTFTKQNIFLKKIWKHKDNCQHKDKINKFFNAVFGFEDF